MAPFNYLRKTFESLFLSPAQGTPGASEARSLERLTLGLLVLELVNSLPFFALPASRVPAVVGTLAYGGLIALYATQSPRFVSWVARANVPIATLHVFFCVLWVGPQPWAHLFFLCLILAAPLVTSLAETRTRKALVGVNLLGFLITQTVLAQWSGNGEWPWLGPALGLEELSSLRAINSTLAGLTLAFIPLLTSYSSARLRQSLVREQAKRSQVSKIVAVGEMASGIAHEINNPLAIIVGQIHLLEENMSAGQINPQELTRGLELIDRTAMRISTIVRSLRNLSRDTSHSQLKPLDAREPITEALNLCSMKLKTRGIKIVNELSDRVPITGDLSQLGQVFLNLFSNSYYAVQDLPFEARWIKLSARVRDNRTEVLVEDGGSGIPAEVQAKIMDPFFTTKPIGEGTGLGLSISRTIIEEVHHGNLYIDNERPNTCFVISFPTPAKSAELPAAA